MLSAWTYHSNKTNKSERHTVLPNQIAVFLATRNHEDQLGRVKRIWYLSPMRAAKVQASLRIRAVSPEPPLLAHTSNESRGTFRQKARYLAPLNGWACAVNIFHDGMLEDTNSLDAAQLWVTLNQNWHCIIWKDPRDAFWYLTWQHNL